MTKIKFGVFASGKPVEELIRHGILADQNGFDSMWVADNHNFRGGSSAAKAHNVCPEPWILLATINSKTRRVMLGPGVTEPIRRHPLITAQSVATLDTLSRGRAILGFGAGDPAIGDPAFGYTWEHPVSRFREAVKYIKALLTATSETPANYCGRFYRLENAYLQIACVQKPHPPIYIGGLGKKMKQITGELGDGWLSYLPSPKTFRKSIKDIEIGATKAGRSIDEIDMCACPIPVAISEDYSIARKAVEPSVFSGRSVEDIAAFGSAENCIRKIEQFVEAGATHIVIRNNGPDIEKTYEIFGKDIIPHFT